MVFFTIVIVAKYFIGVEDCPLFDDGVADGSFESWTKEHEQWHESSNLMQENLLFYNASRLATSPVYVNESDAISDKCATEYKLPEDYCALKPQECSSHAFTATEKVRTALIRKFYLIMYFEKKCSHTGNRTRAAGVRIRNPNP